MRKITDLLLAHSLPCLWSRSSLKRTTKMLACTLSGFFLMWLNSFLKYMLVTLRYSLLDQQTRPPNFLFCTLTKVDRLSNLYSINSWSPDPRVRHTVWGLVIGTIVNWMVVYGFNQSAVQRYSATETLQQSRMYDDSCMMTVSVAHFNAEKFIRQLMTMILKTCASCYE